ncbi:protein of unknown function [Methylacidimicrobium sp. AP8]|nr:protein of unknown function [Methylacidimicrobium sp. AP8]
MAIGEKELAFPSSPDVMSGLWELREIGVGAPAGTIDTSVWEKKHENKRLCQEIDSVVGRPRPDGRLFSLASPCAAPASRRSQEGRRRAVRRGSGRA